MKSMTTGLLATVMVLLPGVAHADRPDRERGFHQYEDVERSRDARPAPPQADRPPAPPTAPSPPSAGGGWNGGNRFNGADTGDRRAQWQAQRGNWGNRGTEPSNWGRPAAQPAAPPSTAGGGLTAGRDGRRDGDNQPDRPRWNGNDGRRPGDDRSRWNSDDGRSHDGDRRWNDHDNRRDYGRWYNDHPNRNGGDNRNRWTGNRDWNHGASRWDGGRWRNDSRYDWRNWRNNHRDLFRGHYYGPRGYSYRPVYRGFFLESFFFGSSYWLSDPFQYRLPPVQWPLRWVRYYDDAVLVDVTTGEVVDVIQEFFW